MTRAEKQDQRQGELAEKFRTSRLGLKECVKHGFVEVPPMRDWREVPGSRSRLIHFEMFRQIGIFVEEESRMGRWLKNYKPKTTKKNK